MELKSKASRTDKRLSLTAAVLTVVAVLAGAPGGAAAAQGRLAQAGQSAHPDAIGKVGATDGSAVKIDPEYLGHLLARYLEGSEEYRQFLIDTTEPAVMVKVLAALQKMGEEQMLDYRTRLAGKCSRR